MNIGGMAKLAIGEGYFQLHMLLRIIHNKKGTRNKKNHITTTYYTKERKSKRDIKKKKKDMRKTHTIHKETNTKYLIQKQEVKKTGKN